MKRKLFYLTASFLLVTGTVSAQKLDVILTDLRYDATENVIIFDIEMKAGEGYVPGTEKGRVGAMNLKYDLFLEPGVTVNLPRATRCKLLGAPNVISVNYNPDDVIRATLDAPRPEGFTVVAMDFPIRCSWDTPTFDFKTDKYTPVATVKIPVTSETKPGSGTFFRQRPTILEKEATVERPLWSRSFWGSPIGQIYDGAFENQSDFSLRQGTVNIEENVVELIRVFPNPTSGIVNISFERAEQREISLYDINGKEVYRKKHDGKVVVLNFGYLPDATYVLKVDGQQFKIIIVH